MNSKKTAMGGVIGALIAIGLVVAGVYAFSGGNFLGMTSTSGAGYGTLQVSMIDPPNVPPEVTAVYINYSSIQVHMVNSSGQSPWYNVTSHGTVDLTSLIANSMMLGQAKLPSGTYNIVRFNVTSAFVTVAGQTHYVSVPSGMVQTTLSGGVDVKQGLTSALLINITPKVTGNLEAGYTLVPSANAQQTSPSGSATSTTTSATSSTSA